MNRQVAVALGATLLAAAPLASAEEAKLKAAAFLSVKAVFVAGFARWSVRCLSRKGCNRGSLARLALVMDGISQAAG